METYALVLMLFTARTSSLATVNNYPSLESCEKAGQVWHNTRKETRGYLCLGVNTKD